MKLREIINIDNPEMYKLHVAKSSYGTQPLDSFINSFEDWQSWHCWYTGKDRFSRQYIISFIDFYPQKGIFLFGGIFEVLDRHWDNLPEHPEKIYDIKFLDDYSDLIGRLKVKINTNLGMATVVNLENYCDVIEVTELLAEPYTHHVFPGYENIDYDFLSIKTIIDRDVPDWKAALGSVKGVYMLTDMNNGKRYIGSAYGENGIWSRWQQYCSTWHGGNIELKKLLDEHDENYRKILNLLS